MSQAIDFYDLPCKYEGVPWNPETLKTRFTLKYKGLSFETIWVEFPNIEATCKKIGAPPSSTKADGTPLYTFPVIHDPNTGASLSDSLLIAEYLDKTYPSTPRVIPAGTYALQAAFVDALESKLGAFYTIMLPIVTWGLNKPSEDYHRQLVVRLTGATVEEMYPKEDKIEEMDGYKKEDEFVMGDVVSLADFGLGGLLLTCKVFLGDDNKDWKRIAGWHDGRWEKLLKGLEKHRLI
ncbi:hypothetical protein VNI00_000513 [Paramarasmius palmivorus]|uniref:GST N-terminal domain-containing protein n=1 Tax=Paramarasmius palmivorus TaxID=297713 RepID=A0AAW0E5V0_9AGAR